MIKIKFHSIVDVITNSSTVIYTYQNSVGEAKELVAEVLSISGIDKTPEDVFYYGVLCDDEVYFERGSEEDWPEDMPKITADWGTPEYKEQNDAQNEWFQKLKQDIIEGKVQKPSWMKSAENDGGWSGYTPDTFLALIPKSPEYKQLGLKIQSLLGSVSADGGRDG